MTQEKNWRDRLGWYLPGVRSKSPAARRQGLIDLLRIEYAFDIMSKTSGDAEDILISRKAQFPAWAWHEIMRLTHLRIAEASDLHWEVLTPQEVSEELTSQDNQSLAAIISAWERHHVTAWRDEHARSLELLVTRAVCNETAEHCQHLRGHRPPGGLTPKPKWYKENEAGGSQPGSYFMKPTSETHYRQGASILWLRFVGNRPSTWQIARNIETKDKIGLLPVEFTKTDKSRPKDAWVYNVGEEITRTRTLVQPDGKKQVEQQWLRWIHEATVAEVAETVDGRMVITFETALPDHDRDTSSVGIFKMPLAWHLSDGSEDQFNRSFVGYVPEGPISVEQLQPMLDWRRIFAM
jgi:hypothetical protein